MRKVEQSVIAMYESRKGMYAIINATAKPDDLGLKRGYRYECEVTGPVNVLIIDIPKNNIPGNKAGVMLFNLPGEYKGTKVSIALTEAEALKLGLDGKGEAPVKCFVTVQSYEKKVTNKDGVVSKVNTSYIAFTENTSLPLGNESVSAEAESAEVDTEKAESVKGG